MNNNSGADPCRQCDRRPALTPSCAAALSGRALPRRSASWSRHYSWRHMQLAICCALRGCCGCSSVHVECCNPRSEGGPS